MTGFLLWLGVLAALVLVTLALYRRPPRVTLSRDLPGHVFSGGQFTLTLTVRVRSALPVRVFLDDSPPRTLVPDAIVDFGGLLWGDTVHTVPVRVTANRRGVYEWAPAQLRWADPFGLRWHSLSLDVPDRIEVYPGTHGLVLPDLLRPLLSEGALSRTLGLEDPISLRGVRPYVPGDPPTRVAWKLSAHTGELMVREVERTASSSLHVHLDLNGNETYVESAVRLAASLVQEAFDLGLPVAVGTAHGATEAGRTPEAMRSVLRRLAEARPLALDGIAPPRAGSNLIVVTQRAGDALVSAAMLARATASRVVIVALPEGFYLEPGERGRRVTAAPPDEIRELERRAGILAEEGVLVFVLRGNQSVLRLGS